MGLDVTGFDQTGVDVASDTVTRHGKKMALLFMLPCLVGATSHAPPDPERGKAEGACRKNEHGPALIVTALGLKDRQGYLKLEVYPSNDHDFLENDDILIAAKKTFRRSEIELPPSGLAELCVRLPSAGIYAISLLHDRDKNRKFGLSIDGVGFAGNPKLGWSKPKAKSVSVSAGTGLTHIKITMNYRRGLFSFEPLDR